MLAMYLAYRLFMARDNQHSFNRGILLLIYFVSFMATPIIFSLDNFNTHQTTQTLAIGNIDIISTTEAPSISRPMWGSVLIWIFLTGMIVVAIKTVTTWCRLTDVIRSGEKFERDGYTLVVTENERFAPFSWMHYIVISRKDFENNCPAIATHELKHIHSRHWIDLMLAQIVCIINWFNPAAWLMRDELMLVHEYQADRAVISGGHNPQEYQMLLVKKAVGDRFPSLANSLNHSKLKKRITMMYKEKSSAGRKLKSLALVPMFALALGVASAPAVRAAVSTISSSDVSVDKGSENLSQDKPAAQSFTVSDFYDNGKKTMIVIQGKNVGDSLSVSGGTFTSTGNTNYATSLNCNLKNGVATIVATFPTSQTREHKDPSLTLFVNGKEVAFNLEDAANNGKSVTKNVQAFVLSDSDGMEIFLDGRKIGKR